MRWWSLGSSAVSRPSRSSAPPRSPRSRAMLPAPPATPGRAPGTSPARPPRLPPIERDVAGHTRDPVAGPGHVPGARRELARLANHPLGLGQLPEDVEQARERFTGNYSKAGEDVPMRLGRDRARPHYCLLGATRPAQGSADRERRVQERLEIEPAGRLLARLRAS